jgi:hypothetical protein
LIYLVDISLFILISSFQHKRTLIFVFHHYQQQLNIIDITVSFSSHSLHCFSRVSHLHDREHFIFTRISSSSSSIFYYHFHLKFYEFFRKLQKSNDIRQFERRRIDHIKRRNNKKVRNITWRKKKRRIENDNDIILEYFVRYLDSTAHFFISKSSIACLNIEKSFTRSTKSTINVNIIKTFCDLIKNSVINKRWRKTRKFRITAEQSIYFLFLDKKFKNNEDYIMINSATFDINATLNFHFVTTLGSRISQNKILFIRKMSTVKKRTEAVIAMTIAHYHWKIQTHTLYKDECRKYINRRIQWEIHLVKETFKISNILWLITAIESKRLNWSKFLNISEDCRSLIEVEEVND